MKLFSLLIACLFSISNVLAVSHPNIKYGVADSIDKQRIAYSVYGSEELALVFIHGWSCDSRYWQNQLIKFSEKYKVITIDLAGHGNSSSNRSEYTIKSFAKDVQAVLIQESINSAVLIGHSMGGAVIAEVAKLTPEKVKGIIGVDTLQNVAETIPQQALDSMIKPFEHDFNLAMEDFVAHTLTLNTDDKIKRWITKDMSSASKAVAINAFKHYLGLYVTGEASSLFKGVEAPVVTINARLWPTNPEQNRKYIKNYELIYIEGTGHFPMLEKPDEFNFILSKAIISILNH